MAWGSTERKIAGADIKFGDIVTEGTDGRVYPISRPRRAECDHLAVGFVPHEGLWECPECGTQWSRIGLVGEIMDKLSRLRKGLL
jgi:hypothetical protein